MLALVKKKKRGKAPFFWRTSQNTAAPMACVLPARHRLKDRAADPSLAARPGTQSSPSVIPLQQINPSLQTAAKPYRCPSSTPRGAEALAKDDASPPSTEQPLASSPSTRRLHQHDILTRLINPTAWQGFTPSEPGWVPSRPPRSRVPGYGSLYSQGGARSGSPARTLPPQAGALGASAAMG